MNARRSYAALDDHLHRTLRWRVLAGVADKVGQKLLNAFSIPSALMLLQCCQDHARSRSGALLVLDHPTGSRNQVRLHGPNGNLPGADARCLREAVEQLA
jgi:hypothetical protein